MQSQVTQLHGNINPGTPTSHHAIVSTAATSQPQDSADETLSATSSMQPLSLANPNAANCQAVPNPVPALMDPSLAPGSFQTEPSHELMQHSLPPVPPRIKERIIKGEYIDFSTLLPKAMFSSSPEPDQPSLFTVQLPSSSGDISVRPAIKSRKITSFSSWMEAWNVYLAVTIDHMPSRAPSLIAYQRIITSASVQYPLESWLTYDIQFRTLAASNPSLRWDVRHADLWLQCITPSRTLHSGRWPCPHCGSTTHYPDRCPFHSYSSRQVPNTQWNAYRGQHTVSSNSTSNVPKSPCCRDFNYSSCSRANCKNAHRCKACELTAYPEKAFVWQLIDNMQYGCSIGYTGPQFAHFPKNLPSAFQQPNVIDAALDKECAVGRILDPFPNPPLQNFVHPGCA